MLVLKKLITHQPGHHCTIDSSWTFHTLSVNPGRHAVHTALAFRWTRKTTALGGTGKHQKHRETTVESSSEMIRFQAKLWWFPTVLLLKHQNGPQIVCNMSLLMLTLMNHTNHTWIATKTSLPTDWRGLLLGFSISKYVKRFRKKRSRMYPLLPKGNAATVTTRPVFFQRPT